MATSQTTWRGKPMRYFLIDRLAAGFDRSTCANMFRRFFDVIDTDEEILKILGDGPQVEAEIEDRRAQILEEIKSTDVIGILVKQIHRLDEKSDEVEELDDLIKIVSTLNGAIGTLRPKTQQTESKPVQQITNNYNQMNINFLTDLENDKLISIIDRPRFNRLFSIGTPSDAATSVSAGTGQIQEVTPPHTPQEGRAKPISKGDKNGPDDVGAFL